MSSIKRKATIYATFNDGEQLLSAQVAERACMSQSYASKMLVRMCEESTLARRRVGNVGQHGGAMEYIYFRACDVVERETVPVTRTTRRHRAKVELVAVPYPHVLLSGPPADDWIGKELWSHARIAMCTRK